MAKLTKEQWLDTQKRWESDPRDGFDWLVNELGVSRQAISKYAKNHGWTKNDKVAQPCNELAKVAQHESKLINEDKQYVNKVAQQKYGSCATNEETAQPEIKAAQLSEKQDTESPKSNFIKYPAKDMPPKKLPRGRPTDYREEFNDQAKKLCMLGHTNDDMAFFFEVSPSTIDNWLVKHPDFLGAVKAGRVVADMNVVASLYERAVGYSCIETKVFCVNGEIIEHDIVKHHPPEVGAAKYLLNNRHPKKWSDKVVVEQDVTISTVPREQLDEIYNRNLEKQKEKMKEVMGRAQRLGIASFIDSSAEAVEIEDEL